MPTTSEPRLPDEQLLAAALLAGETLLGALAAVLACEGERVLGVRDDAPGELAEEVDVAQRALARLVAERLGADPDRRAALGYALLGLAAMYRRRAELLGAGHNGVGSPRRGEQP